MNQNILFITLLISIGLANADDLFDGDLSNPDYAECAIHSVEYEKWYLLSERLMNARFRTIALNRFQVFSDSKQGIWQFVPTNHTKNSFYLRNKKYSEDLYADTNFASFNPFTQKRRIVYTWRLAKDMQSTEKAFVWILKKVENVPNQYYILNLAYKEPLYAGSYAYKGNVFTWHMEPKSADKQLMWTLNCPNKQPLIV